MSLRGAVLGLHVEAEELGDYEEDVLIVELLVADKFVGRVGHETLETCHECVHVPGLYLPDKLLYFEVGGGFPDGSVVGDEKFHETFLDFLVRKSKCV